MPTWQNHTRVREPRIHCLFLQTLRSCVATRSVKCSQAFVSFSTNAHFQYGSNEQQPKKTKQNKKQQTHNRFTSTTDIFSKKYLFFFFVFFSSGDTRHFPLRASENLKTAWTIPTLLFVWAKSILQTILKYPLPSAKRLALYKTGLQRDTIMTTHTTH